MSNSRRGMNNENGIEMTTFSETTLKRSRSGSFTGKIVDSPQGVRTGYSEFSFSKTSGVFDVKTILSDIKGGGSRMMSQMESLALENGAQSMVAATSRPGFFKKSGFDYTASQHELNKVKYTQEQLFQQENNRGDVGGGGFSMQKILHK